MQHCFCLDELEDGRADGAARLSLALPRTRFPFAMCALELPAGRLLVGDRSGNVHLFVSTVMFDEQNLYSYNTRILEVDAEAHNVCGRGCS